VYVLLDMCSESQSMLIHFNFLWC